jgi:glycosyltransferase involved in cell wall biosynthesis
MTDPLDPHVPAVGVAIPVYNGERFVAEALRSVLAQSHPVGDVVVLDDGSSDRSAEIARSFGPPVRVERVPHSGIGAARSRALEMVRGEFILPLDADDLLTADSIEVRLPVLLERPEVDIVYGHIRQFAEFADGSPLALNLPQPSHVPNAMLIRRAAFERVGSFATDLRVAETLDWLLRAREAGLVEVTVEDQALWRRVHGANNSLTQRASLSEFPRVLKASLDRRRSAES